MKLPHASGRRAVIDQSKCDEWQEHALKPKPEGGEERR